MKFIGIITLSLVIQTISCYHTGAPAGACESMTPSSSPYAHGVGFQTSAAPFEIYVDSNTYMPGQTIQGKND